MKQIEVFVDSIYQNASGNKKEINELKAEMKSHLIEAVHELKTEGKSEQEAIEIAIERFGGEKEIRSIIGQLFKTQQTFAKWALYLALGFLVLFLSIFGWLWISEESRSRQISLVATEIADILENKSNITPEMKADIEESVKSTSFISAVRIFNVNDIQKSENYGGYGNIFDYVAQAEPDYQYKQTVWAPEWLKPDFFPYGNGDDQWYVGMEQRSFSTIMTATLFVGLAIYWTLFSIWAIINAYHHKRLNIGWGVGFVLFNVVGYLFYYIVGRKQSYIK